MKHWKVAAALGSASLLILTVGCSTNNDSGVKEGSNASETVALGVIAPMSGNFAQVGEHISAGFELGVKHAQEDGLAKDISFTVSVKDDQADAQVATQAARDFMSGGTMLLGGMLTTPTCMAVAPLVDQAGGVLATSVCAGNEVSGVYSGSAPFERTFAMAPRDSMVSLALAETLSGEFPEITEYNVFGYDYAWGRDTWSEFQSGMTAKGVDLNVNQEYWVPLGETNYRSQVSAMSNGLGAEAESALFLSTFGAGTTAFLQQANAFDLVDRVTLLASAGGYEPVARALNGDAPEMWNAYDYQFGAYNTPFNDRFVADYLEANDERPMAWSYEGYMSGYALVAAVDAAGSSEPDAIVEAMKTLEFEGVNGSIRMDGNTHQLLAPVVVTHTVGDPDGLEGIELLQAVVVPAADLLP